MNNLDEEGVKISSEISIGLSVLKKAMKDLEDPKKRGAVIRWLKNQENDVFCSFLWMCKLLEINPAKTKNRIFYNYNIQ